MTVHIDLITSRLSLNYCDLLAVEVVLDSVPTMGILVGRPLCVALETGLAPLVDAIKYESIAGML